MVVFFYQDITTFPAGIVQQKLVVFTETSLLFKQELCPKTRCIEGDGHFGVGVQAVLAGPRADKRSSVVF